MNCRNIHIAIIFIFFVLKVGAQISPGDLTKAHADLEGVFNCTKCHDLGNKVSNEKCLNCHKEIKTRMDRGAGYHASKDVKGKDCTVCHSDHHGRNFDIIRFDKNKFNHTLAGYELTGAHKPIDCRQCHKPDFVEDRELKKRSKTFLGVSRNCNTCHEDSHQKTLGTDCAKCHSTTAFSPATKFDHNKADFALLGKHKTVACLECHKKEPRNGKTFQQFTGIPFSNCNSCHKDPHDSNLGTNCKQCHLEEAFSALGGMKKFNHSETHFPLKGKHKLVDCAGCHNMNASPATIFQDRLGVPTNDCVRCHKDVHENKFGSNCAECHNENSFRATSGSMKEFNHSRTAFALEGKHLTVDCKKCHTKGSFTDPLPHVTCDACHKDYHEGQLASILGLSPDCSKCHTVNGFNNSLYTITDHNKAKFPLKGAHLATPCVDCHKPDTKKWQFRNIGERCVDCHTDVHDGFIDKKYYPNQSCESCHVNENWQENHFDHKLTKFKLLGAHANQPCMACHGKKDDAGKLPQRYQQFANTSTSCTACHKNVHGQQFEKEGVTDCERCHAFNNWDAVKFDHNKSAFKLDGKHAKVACASCHKATEMNGELVVQYKMKSFKCIDCHL